MTFYQATSGEGEIEMGKGAEDLLRGGTWNSEQVLRPGLAKTLNPSPFLTVWPRR